jgi:hypothetical protein
VKLPLLPPCSFSLLGPYFDPCPERLNSSLTSHGRERFQFGITHTLHGGRSFYIPLVSERSAAFADELKPVEGLLDGPESINEGQNSSIPLGEGIHQLSDSAQDENALIWIALGLKFPERDPSQAA